MKTADRVRASTSGSRNQRIDQDIAQRVRDYARRSPDELSRRIAELEREWDMERALQTNASLLALAGIVLGAARGTRWLWLPGTVLGFLLQHALRGWCPPVPLLRGMGFRTRREIDQEKYALKVLRGDFPSLLPLGEQDSELRARLALEAVRGVPARPPDTLH